MKHLRFCFDVISPYAYLAFERLPQALAGLSVEVSYQPLLLAGLLAHWRSKGPAEIEPKRAWTYRQVAWLAHRQGVRLDLPAQHPFNPLALLRLALACEPNRRVVEALFTHVWQDGGDAADAARLACLTAELAPARDPHSAEVKAELRSATDEAIARGVFGAPAMLVGEHLFWGNDRLQLLDRLLAGELTAS